MSSGIKFQTVYYPESDGKPMGETDLHRRTIVRLLLLLENRYRGQDAYVSGDLLVYYGQGNPKKFVVPDVFVVKGMPQKDRRIYRMWVERLPPNAIIEVTSRKTRKKDTLEKPQLYAKLGVREYFVFDPESDYLDPPLQGYRLGKTGYRRIAADAKGRLSSQELGVQLVIDTTGLQLFDSDSGERLLTAEEVAAQLKGETAWLKEENRQLRAELARRKPSSK